MDPAFYHQIFDMYWDIRLIPQINNTLGASIYPFYASSSLPSAFQKELITAALTGDIGAGLKRCYIAGAIVMANMAAKATR